LLAVLSFYWLIDRQMHQYLQLDGLLEVIDWNIAHMTAIPEPFKRIRKSAYIT
jgi:hypothetical protein